MKFGEFSEADADAKWKQKKLWLSSSKKSYTLVPQYILYLRTVKIKMKGNRIRICDQKKTTKPQLEKLDRTCDHNQVKLYTKTVVVILYLICSSLKI